MAGCGSDADSDAGAGSGAGGAAGAGGPGELATAIGSGDGSPGSVSFATVFEPPEPLQATDLDFHPVRDELWISLRENYQDEPCTEAIRQGCNMLVGRVGVVTAPGSPAPTSEIKVDANGWHFMRLPPSIAFGEGDNFAVCGEARTGNFLDGGIDFIGPTWFSADPNIFGPHGPGGNGSHLDMLHGTPYCMGIAHESANIYWAFNGQVGALDRYDFRESHVPGGDDHSDGAIWRFAEGTVSRVPGVPSHMVFDPASSALYVSDTGNGRVVKLDTTSGTPNEAVSLAYDPIEQTLVTGAALEDVVPPGTLQLPSGLALADGVLYVVDNATSRIHAFDTAGRSIRTLDTGLPGGSLAGIAIGPDGKAYFTDMGSGIVRRIDVPDEQE